MSRSGLIAHQRTVWLKKKAQELGFISVGVSKAEKLTQEAPRLENQYFCKENLSGNSRLQIGSSDREI